MVSAINLLSARLKPAKGSDIVLKHKLMRMERATGALPETPRMDLLINRDTGDMLLFVRVAAGHADSLNHVTAFLHGLWNDGMLRQAPEFELWQPENVPLEPVEKAPPPAGVKAANTAPDPASPAANAPLATDEAAPLFSPSAIGFVEVPNRMVRSATYEAMAGEDGSATQELADVLSAVAHGGTGLVITGHAFVSLAGRARPQQLGAHSDDMLPGLRLLAEAVKPTAARVVLQLNHCGCNKVEDDIPAMGPSDCTGDFGAPCQAMTLEDIRRTTLDFAKAAVRAKVSGFDGVQIHAAHGYLLSQFLSPAFNKRTDQYGGTAAARALMLVETVQLIRDAVDDDFAVLVKMNAEDFIPGGLPLEDSLQIADMLQEAGIDALELSGGTLVAGDFAPSRKDTTPADPPYYLEQAKRFREFLEVPLILTGGIRSLDTATRLVADAVTDFVGLSRPLIRQPDLPQLWHQGRSPEATCTSCNGCLARIRKGDPLACVLDLAKGQDGA